MHMSAEREDMLSYRKIRLMTQLAIYEKKTGRDDLKLGRYYKSDYVRLNVLKTAITVTISYVVILAIVAFYKIEYLLDNALTLDYKSLGKTILIIYVCLMGVYLVATLFGYAVYYQSSRNKLGRYFKMLGRMREIYAEEDGYSPDDGEEITEADR